MRVNFLRLFSLFITAIVIFGGITPLAFAADEYIQKPTFWNWLNNQGGILNGVVAYSMGKACPNTEDGYHRSSERKGVISGNYGTMYSYYCDYCGKKFDAYNSDLDQSYQEQVSELPAPAYNSDGSLYISALHDRMYEFHVSGFYGNTYYSFLCEHCNQDIQNISAPSCNFTLDCSNNSVVLFPKSGSSYFRFGSFLVKFSLTIPIDGFYTLVENPALSGYYFSENQDRFSLDGFSKSFSGSTSRVFYSSGSSFSSDFTYSFSGSCPSLSYFSSSVSPPIYKVEPFDPESGTVGESYTPDTRPTVITGDYGIVDNQGVATVIKDCTIVNETTNNYYNPATGQNYPIKDWSYDYPNREYTITTDSNNTVTITYGDENVTIQEGDTIYNIYYVVDGMGEEKPPCEHDWQIGNKTDPTCSQPGQQFYTCSKCGERKTETIPTTAHDWQADTKTDPTCTQPGRQPYTCVKCSEVKSDTIPALGHNWQVKQSVNTQYDDTGQLVQEGYTIYECTRCGEQYKTGSGAGPPPSGGGDSPGGSTGGDAPGEEGGSIWDKMGALLGTLITGISTLLGSVLGKLLEALTSLSELILGGLGTVVETVLSLFDSVPRLFGGFLAFLSAVFPFLPEEMITLLTFGLAAIVFIGILKAVRK